MNKTSNRDKTNNYTRRLHRIKVEQELPQPADPLAPLPMLFATSSARRFHDLVEAAAERWS